MIKLNKYQKKIAENGYKIERRPTRNGKEYIVLEKKISPEGHVYFSPKWKKTGFWNIFHTEMFVFSSVKDAKNFIYDDVSKNYHNKESMK